MLAEMQRGGNLKIEKAVIEATEESNIGFPLLTLYPFRTSAARLCRIIPKPTSPFEHFERDARLRAS